MPNPQVSITIRAKNVAATGVEKAVATLDRLRVAGSKVKAALFSAQGALATFGIGFGAAKAISFFVDVNKQADALISQLKVLTGSRKNAEETFAALDDVARTSSFNVEQITESYIRLRTSGIMPTREMLRQFGDLAAARGKSILDFAMAVEDAVTGEMERLKEFGIKAKQNGDTVAFTFNSVTTEVANTAAGITAYLESLGDLGIIHGSMIEQTKTLGGSIRRLYANLARLALIAGGKRGSGGATDAVKGLFDQLSDFTQGLIENADKVRGWTHLLLTIGKIILASVIQPLRIAGNLLDATGESLAVIANLAIAAAHAIAAAVLEARAAVGDVLPGVDTSELHKRADEQVAAMKAAVDRQHELQEQSKKDVLDAVGAIGDLIKTWGKLGEAIDAVDAIQDKADLSPPELPSGNGAGGQGGGGQTPLTAAQQERIGGLPFPKLAGPTQGPEMQGAVQVPQPNRDFLHVGELEKFAAALDHSLTAGQDLSQLLSDMTGGVISDFGDAITNAFQAFASGAEGAGKAFESAILGSLAAVAKGLGDFYTAKAVAAIGEGLFTANPVDWAAAAQYFAAATGFYALAGGAGAISSSGAGGGGGASGAAAANNDLSGGAKGEAVIVLDGSWSAILTDPRAQDSFAAMLAELSDRRVVVRHAA